MPLNWLGLLLSLQVAVADIPNVPAVACIESTVLGESRGESLLGQALVRRVILNRAESSHQHPCAIVSARRQFGGFHLRHLAGATDRWWAARVFVGTEGCGAGTHFHAVTETPYWANSKRMRRLCRVGGHIFYKELR